MSKENPFGAIGPLSGFTYQICYFLYRLLTIRDGETVSLEKIDDVGLEGDGKQTYYQLKHSINSSSSSIKRMADRDTDLWKTLSMWVSIIKKKDDEEAQRQWIDKSEFVLISNKTAENNKFVELIEAYKSDDGKWEALEKYLSEQASKEPRVPKEDSDKDKNDIFVYTKSVNDYGLKKELFKHVAVEFESDSELKEKINRELQYNKLVPGKRVDDLRFMLYGALNDAILDQKAEYTMESYAEAFGPLFNDMRTRKFIPLNRKVVLPERPMEQTFVKQLQGIDAPHSNDLQEMVKLTEEKLQFENDYNASNKAAGKHVQQQFEKDMHKEWKNIFDAKLRSVNFMSGEDKIKDAGWEVFDKVKGVRLKYDQEDIGATESNGCYYHFSDGETPQIGWRCDWETLYNGKEWTTD